MSLRAELPLWANPFPLAVPFPAPLPLASPAMKFERRSSSAPPRSQASTQSTVKKITGEGTPTGKEDMGFRADMGAQGAKVQGTSAWRLTTVPSGGEGMHHQCDCEVRPGCFLLVFSVVWCSLFVLIQHGEEGASQSPRWIRALGKGDG